MQGHLPTGSTFKQAAAWELIVASLILAIMLFLKIKGKGISKMSIVERRPFLRLVPLFVLFVLVFSSAMSFFVD